jgi:hypothetical protein
LAKGGYVHLFDFIPKPDGRTADYTDYAEKKSIQFSLWASREFPQRGERAALQQVLLVWLG